MHALLCCLAADVGRWPRACRSARLAAACGLAFGIVPFFLSSNAAVTVGFMKAERVRGTFHVLCFERVLLMCCALCRALTTCFLCAVPAFLAQTAVAQCASQQLSVRGAGYVLACTWLLSGTGCTAGGIGGRLRSTNLQPAGGVSGQCWSLVIASPTAAPRSESASHCIAGNAGPTGCRDPSAASVARTIELTLFFPGLPASSAMAVSPARISACPTRMP